MPEKTRLRVAQKIGVSVEWLTGQSAWLQLCAHVCNFLSMSCFYSKLVKSLKCQSKAVSSLFRLIFQPDHA